MWLLQFRLAKVEVRQGYWEVAGGTLTSRWWFINGMARRASALLQPRPFSK